MPENLPYASYTEYTVQVVHSHESGVCVNPIAGTPPQYLSMVRLHAAMEFLQVFWTAMREGAPPILPSHKSYLTNYNRVFLGGARTAVVVPVFGAHSWSVSGVWVFALPVPEGMDSNFALSMPPWEGAGGLGANMNDFMIPSQNFQSGILNPLNDPIPLSPDPDVPLLNLQMGISG